MYRGLSTATRGFVQCSAGAIKQKLIDFFGQPDPYSPCSWFSYPTDQVLCEDKAFEVQQ